MSHCIASDGRSIVGDAWLNSIGSGSITSTSLFAMPGEHRWQVGQRAGPGLDPDALARLAGVVQAKLVLLGHDLFGQRDPRHAGRRLRRRCRRCASALATEEFERHGEELPGDWPGPNGPIVAARRRRIPDRVSAIGFRRRAASDAGTKTAPPRPGDGHRRPSPRTRPGRRDASRRAGARTLARSRSMRDRHGQLREVDHHEGVALARAPPVREDARARATAAARDRRRRSAGVDRRARSSRWYSRRMESGSASCRSTFLVAMSGSEPHPWASPS